VVVVVVRIALLSLKAKHLKGLIELVRGLQRRRAELRNGVKRMMSKLIVLSLVTNVCKRFFPMF